jgi:hypothetical protein
VNFCIAGKCLTSEFECADKSCIPQSKKCDQSRDCNDGSDEFDCPSTLTFLLLFRLKILLTCIFNLDFSLIRALQPVRVDVQRRFMRGQKKKV